MGTWAISSSFLRIKGYPRYLSLSSYIFRTLKQQNYCWAHGDLTVASPSVVWISWYFVCRGYYLSHSLYSLWHHQTSIYTKHKHGYLCSVMCHEMLIQSHKSFSDLRHHKWYNSPVIIRTSIVCVFISFAIKKPSQDMVKLMIYCSCI